MEAILYLKAHKNPFQSGHDEPKLDGIEHGFRPYKLLTVEPQKTLEPISPETSNPKPPKRLSALTPYTLSVRGSRV